MKFTVGSDNANQPVHQGMVVDFRVTPLFGILIRWQSRITQVDAPRSFTDIQTKGPYKQAIINNADCKILLDQSKYENRFDQLQDMLGLNDRQKALILSMNRANDPKRIYKEVYIYPPGKVYRTEVSLEEYLTYTTEESEKVKVQQYTAKYGSIKKGIQALADDMRSGTAPP
ncbi:hypothetical protein [Parapedobacter sp. 2B3]|uniref:TraG/VirB4 family ATPase n=1 Tax=Parapedobacter sp. 2B3 TaxID=3342381 RepID=UPI0035B655CC